MCENEHLQLLSLKASDSNLQKWQKCPKVMNPMEQSNELKMGHFKLLPLVGGKDDHLFQQI